MIIQNILFRIISSIILITLTHFYVPVEYKLIVYTFLPFLTDPLDGSLNIIKNISFTSYEYQSWDKILDFFTYLVIIFLIKPFYSKYIFNILIILLLWRGIGVFKFYNSNNIKDLWLHMDAINNTLVILYLSSIFPNIKQNLEVYIIIGILFKAYYERFIHHTKNYQKL